MGEVGSPDQVWDRERWPGNEKKRERKRGGRRAAHTHARDVARGARISAAAWVHTPASDAVCHCL